MEIPNKDPSQQREIKSQTLFASFTEVKWKNKKWRVKLKQSTLQEMIQY